MKEVKILGIDLAKTNFSICGMSGDGEVLFRKALRRKELVEFTANYQPCVIGMEACGGSHYWGRLFLRQGHQVKMMTVEEVKRFAPRHKKNDATDAQAIALAVRETTIHCIRIKETKQQDLDVLRNLREQFLKQKVSLINQAHAVCLEYGIALPKGKAAASIGRIIEAIEDDATELTAIAREVAWRLLEEAKELSAKAKVIEKKIESLVIDEENFKLLKTIPGVGLITAAAILSHTGGSVDHFTNGRQFAAYLGLVPKQYSTGGKTSLRGITKHGHAEIRRLLVLGTRAVMVKSETRKDKISEWITQKKTARGFMKANIALANKTARMIYAVLKTQKPYCVMA